MDTELEDCPVSCPAKAGGDHDHTPEPFVPGWMPWSAYGWPTGLTDHPPTETWLTERLTYLRCDVCGKRLNDDDTCDGCSFDESVFHEDEDDREGQPEFNGAFR